MGDDKAVRRLVEMCSSYFTTNKAVKVDLKYSLRSDVLRNLQDVLFSKQLVFFSQYISFFNVCRNKITSSRETCLKFVISGCRQVILVNSNVYEKFLDGFALLIRMSIEIHLATGVNFYRLVPEIFMLLYRRELKESFHKSGGFRKFLEYINESYLDSVCIVRNISHFYDHNVSNSLFVEKLREEKKKLMQKQQASVKMLNFLIMNVDTTSLEYAKSVLKNTKVEFPPFPNECSPLSNSLNLSDFIQLEMPKGNITLEIMKKFGGLENPLIPGLNFDVLTGDVSAGQMVDAVQFNNIIEAVTRHNKSKSSSHARPQSRIQTEADGVLGNLKSKIISLIEVLDDYDKE